MGKAKDRSQKWWIDVAGAAWKWKFAREAVVKASIYPISNLEYRALFNALAEAEDALNKALGEF